MLVNNAQAALQIEVVKNQHFRGQLFCVMQTDHSPHWRAHPKTAHSTEKTVIGSPLIFVLWKSVLETHCTPFWSHEFPSGGFSISPEILWTDSIRLVLTQELDVTKSVSPLLGYNWVSLLGTIGNWPTSSAHGANVCWLLEILLRDTLNSLRAVFLFGDCRALTSLTHLHYSYYMTPASSSR